MILDAPGFFGKVPARGDFLSCRLSPELAASWDGWLGRLTLAVREAAGSAWPEVWLTAPLWHFALGAGVVGDTPAAGVLVASADRVGRMFPFTIIGPSGGEPEAAWLAEVEALVLAALDDAFEPSALDAALSRLGPPQEATAVAAGQTLWWCRGSDLVTPSRVLVSGLPERDRAVAMVLGGGEPGLTEG